MTHHHLATVADRDTPPFLARPDLACRTADPDVFYPPSRTSYAAALAICEPCPAKSECAAWAIETRQDWGAWGATTPEQRRAIWRHNAQRRTA